MDDGVAVASTLYVPFGTPPAGGWPAVMLMHGLGETTPRSAMNLLAETYLAPEGFAVLTFDARGMGRSGGLVSLDGPREIQDVRELFDWLTTQPGIAAQRSARSASPTAAARSGARRPRACRSRRSSRRRPGPTSTARSSPQDLPNSRRRARLLAVDRQPRLPDAAADRATTCSAPEPARGHAFADARSSRALLANIHVPTFLMQGRRDFAFDIDQALAAYVRLRGPKRLYLGDLGHAPSTNPPASSSTSCPRRASGSTAT